MRHTRLLLTLLAVLTASTFASTEALASHYDATVSNGFHDCYPRCLDDE